MAHTGRLIFTDDHEQEHRVEVTGDLEWFEETDGGATIRGVLSVDRDRVGAVRAAMERQARDDAGAPGARYTGEVVDTESDSTRPVTDVPLLLLDVYDNGNVRVRSTQPDEES